MWRPSSAFVAYVMVADATSNPENVIPDIGGDDIDP
jgi:hypothetical protein